VDVDDDFDNDTTDKEDEDKKDDKNDDKRKGDKKKKSSNVLDEMDSDGKVSPEDDHSEGEIDDVEEFSIQEASVIKKRHENQDVDTEAEERVKENNYYTQIARNSKDLEHLYKTLLKRADKETIVGELLNLFNELKEMREKYFSSRYDIEHSKDAHQSYHGMQKIIEQDMDAIQQNIKKLQDPKEQKLPKNLVKKTIKMMNNLQQDMITECQRSQPFQVRHFRDISKKMWMFENYEEDEMYENELYQETNVSSRDHLNARQQCIKDLHEACRSATAPLEDKKMKYKLSEREIEKIRDGVTDMQNAFSTFLKNSKGTSSEFELITDHLRNKIERYTKTINTNLDKASSKGSMTRIMRDQVYNALTGMRDSYSKLMFENLPTAERAAVIATDIFLVKDAKKHMMGLFKESAEDDMFAKIGEMMVHYRKQKELQDLAEKNGVQINGVRYTDDSIMNIVTSVVALMMARNEGDPRYHQLVEQGMRKRSLKVEIINSYKDRANELINQYDHGPIVGVTPAAGGTIEIIPETESTLEEFYIDENGEMHSSYYQESDEESTNDPFYKLEQEIGKKLPSIYRKIVPTKLDPVDHMREMSERFVDKKIETGNDAYSEYTFNELYSVEQVLKNLSDHDGYLSFDEGDGFGNCVLIKISDWKIYLYIHDESDKYVKIANSLEDLCSKLNVSIDKLIDEYYQYYQEADEDDSDGDDKDEEIDDDDDADEEDDLDESDSEEKDAKDDDDEETEDEDDDDNVDEDIEEFYIDENGEMHSSWYAESETSETVTRPVRQRNDEEQSWEFRPGRKIGDIQFGMSKDKVHSILSQRYGDPNPQSNTKDFSSAETYGNKFSVYYDSSDKVEAVEINNNIVVEMDRSIIFPGDPTNLKKKALDLQPDKANPERGLTSKIMAVSIIIDPSNKIKSMLCTRKGFFKEKEFKAFDKVSNMISSSDETSGTRKMKEIYKFLDKHHILSPQGKQMMKHIDKETILTSNELSDRGCEFMVKYYDQVRGADYQSIRQQMEDKWKQFNEVS
jgi:hypothetical protein